jgi:predicted O-methyltransferase YrrM
MADASRTVHDVYEEFCKQPQYAITHHLPYLKQMAARCDVIVELGVSAGRSSSAFLCGMPENGRLISYDVVITKSARELHRLAGDGGPEWLLCHGRSEEATPGEHDMLFVDSLHTYKQVKAELDLWADHCRRWIILHDTVTFGAYAADGETGRHVPRARGSVQVTSPEQLGIRMAVDELMMRDDSWHVERHDWRSHGLLTLERRID